MLCTENARWSTVTMHTGLTSNLLASWTVYQMWTTHIRCSSVPRPLSSCVGPGQLPTPEGLSPPANAAQTKGQAGVTGNACSLVGEGGEGQPYCEKLPYKQLS